MNPSAVRVCPGGTVVFTCTTNTGKLLWKSNGMNAYYAPTEENRVEDVGIFTVNLTRNGSRMELTSTATVHNVHLDHNRTVISCSDSDFQGESVTRAIQISGTKVSGTFW